jgi:RNA-directed DNA polymerase
MSQLERLCKATCLEDLAQLLNFKPQAITYILFKLTETEKYIEFEISKQSGGKRTISAPTERLKKLQKNLADLLANCLSEVEATGKRKTPFVHGFVKGKSIVTNAKNHRNKRWVLNLDLHDFFGTINFGRVRGILIKDRDFLLHPTVATLIAQISCYKNALPQGAPTSPIISNIVGRPLDLKLVDLAKKYGCNYTRFADDITFSTNKSDFPEQLAKLATDTTHDWVLGNKIRETVEKAGFVENPKKTRLQYFKNRQEVTGLVVNKRVNVTREYRKTVRAMLNRLVTTGKFEMHSTRAQRTANKRTKQVDPLRQLQGMLGFIDWIDLRSTANARHLSPEAQAHIKTKSHRLDCLTSQEKQYRKFLLYRNFFSANQPLILTEGKTDKTHLRVAAIKLGNGYPDLVNVTSSPPTLLFRIFPSLARRTNALLGLCGGTSDLAAFLNAYKTETKKFDVLQLGQPIIVMVDKDNGWKAIRGAIGGGADGSQPFYHLCTNLYVVCIPPPPGKPEGCIEDLYEAETLNIELDGKFFDKSNTTKDKGKHYGKTVFAEKIILTNSAKIDFSGFKPLLDKLAAVVQFHKIKFPSS